MKEKLRSITLILLLPLTLLWAMALPVYMAALTLLNWPYKYKWREHGKLHPNTATYVVVLLLAWPLITCLWSLTPVFSLRTWGKTLGIMILGAAYYFAMRQQRLMHYAPRMVLAMVVVSLIVAMEALPQGGLMRLIMNAVQMDYNNFAGKQINRGLAALAVLVWPVALGCAVMGKKRMAMAVPLLAAPSIFLMHSLSAKTGLLVGAVVFYVLCYAPRLSRVIVVGLPLLLLLWPLSLRSIELSVRNHAQIYFVLPESSQHRLDIWNFAREHIMQKPWLGWGMEASRAIPGGDVVYAPGRVYMPLHPHNSILQILLEQGIIGLACALAALAMLLWRIQSIPIHYVYERAAAFAALICYITIGLSGFGMWQSWWLSLAWGASGLWSAMCPPREEKHVS